MNIIAIDPGPTKSALVYLEDGRPTFTLLERNEAIRDVLMMDNPWLPGQFHDLSTLVIEQIESFGMPVGREIFETVFWAGRFAECWGGPWTRVTRKAVKLHLCGQTRAKDPNIRQALIDRFGGQERAIGRKAAPGPLYTIKADLWSALALGLTYLDQQQPARIAG
jgi:hypothetical protein